MRTTGGCIQSYSPDPNSLDNCPVGPILPLGKRLLLCAILCYTIFVLEVKRVLEGLVIALILAVDQVVKLWSEANLTPLGTSIPVIKGVFHLTSAHNTGAAWGMLPGQKWLFLILTVVVCCFLGYVLIRFRKRLTLLSRITLSLLLAGALGNAIDRATLSYVRDMFDFCLINFPIFNVADSALTIGCCLLIVDVLFLKERSMFELPIRAKKAAAGADEEMDEKTAADNEPQANPNHADPIPDDGGSSSGAPPLQEKSASLLTEEASNGSAPNAGASHG